MRRIIIMFTLFMVLFFGCMVMPVEDLIPENTRRTINFDANQGEGNMLPIFVEQGSTVTLPLNTFTRTGMTFNGWNTSYSGTGTAYADGAELIGGEANVTLVAQWQWPLHTITFHANGGTGTMDPQVVEQYKQFTTNANTFTRTGYSFVRWDTSPTDDRGRYFPGQTYIMDEYDFDLYAIWEPNLKRKEFTNNNVISIDVDPTNRRFITIDYVGGFIFQNSSEDAASLQLLRTNNAVYFKTTASAKTQESHGEVPHLASGTAISSTDSWSSSSEPLICGGSSSWNVISHEFIPVRILKDSSWYQGYLEVSFDASTDAFTIHSFAYKETAGASLTAGELAP